MHKEGNENMGTDVLFLKQYAVTFLLSIETDVF